METPIVYKAALTDAELDILDGRCSPDTQKVCDSSKSRRAVEARTVGLTQKQAAMVTKIIEYARTQGVLTYTRTSVTSCPTCGVTPGYYLRARTSRSGRKGEPDYSKPKMVSAVDYGRGFVTIGGHVSTGCCAECNKVIEPLIVAELANMPTAVPAWFPSARLLTERTWGGERKVAALEKCDIVKCVKCGTIQHERQMGRRPTIMGDGTFPAKCRACDNEKIPLFGGQVFTRTDGWVVYDLEAHRVLRANDPTFTPEAANG